MTKIVRLTVEGRAALEQELQELIDQRPEVSERIAIARDYGDLKENEEYSAAKAEQARAENRVLEIRDILLNAKLIKKKSSDKVELGVTVVVEANGKESTYMIVGSLEADPTAGKISDVSPVGKILMGKKAGEEAEFETPRGKIVYKVKSIN